MMKWSIVFLSGWFSGIERKYESNVLRVSAYADRLLEDLTLIGRFHQEIQRNWIGRSEGAFIQFHLKTAKKH